MSTLGALRERVAAFPRPGSTEHSHLSRDIAASKCKFIQDSDGYWGEPENLRTCTSQWVNGPGGWYCDKNKKPYTTFRRNNGAVVRQRKRVTVLATSREVVGKTAEQYIAEGWARRDYNGHEWFVKDSWWCSNAIAEGAFQCSQTGMYYCELGSHYTRTTIDGRDYCHEEAVLYYWDRDERFHTEPQPARAAEAPRDTNRLPEYHSTPRAWKKERPKDVVYGCELEIYCNISRMEVLKMAQDLGLIGERDGSIDQTAGIEIIGKPGTLAWHADPAGPWMKFLAQMTEKPDGKSPRAKGWDAGAGYGMHVSINRLALPQSTQTKMIKFVNDNATLCAGVAGRENNERVAAYKIKDLQDIQYDLGRNASDKYEALAIRDEQRLEMRIFRSTLDRAGFMKNVEFCAALVDFCRDANYKDLTETCFRSWLRDQRKTGERTSPFPNLCKRLILPAAPKTRKVSS